eukprot:TRINITY_DN56914_c0_g1_i1.p1 TRINITY_DN56914_c0_g1~~TRINITY_DN56914_c0_g1_i1.p1  ORF type:complete len:371 (-),score=107.57 TRINITY_DN56914_c0_g1_i1:60-1172(-)
MLQATALYQQQLHQNERALTDLHSQVAEKERALRSLKRRSQQAELETKAAKEAAARAREDLARWSAKRTQFEELHSGSEHEAHRAKHAALREDVQRLQEELAPCRSEVLELRDRLAACEGSGREQAARLNALKAKCQQAMVELKAEQTEELANLRAQHTEELARHDVQHQTQVSALLAHHAEEVSRLRCAAEDADRRRNRHRKARDDAAEQLLARQREGALLQQQCADARNEVLELTGQVKACQALPRVMSQLGLSGINASFQSHNLSLPFFAEDARLDAELQQVRRRCKSLERECARTHDSLERKQSECERWRRLGVTGGSVGRLAVTAGDGASILSATPTFTLGPASDAPLTPSGLPRRAESDAGEPA